MIPAEFYMWNLPLRISYWGWDADLLTWVHSCMTKHSHYYFCGDELYGYNIRDWKSILPLCLISYGWKFQQFARYSRHMSLSLTNGNLWCHISILLAQKLLHFSSTSFIEAAWTGSSPKTDSGDENLHWKWYSLALDVAWGVCVLTWRAQVC